jgi:hypothetical protein
MNVLIGTKTQALSHMEWQYNSVCFPFTNKIFFLNQGSTRGCEDIDIVYVTKTKKNTSRFFHTEMSNFSQGQGKRSRFGGIEPSLSRSSGTQIATV